MTAQINTSKAAPIIYQVYAYDPKRDEHTILIFDSFHEALHEAIALPPELKGLTIHKFKNGQYIGSYNPLTGKVEYPSRPVRR